MKCKLLYAQLKIKLQPESYVDIFSATLAPPCHRANFFKFDRGGQTLPISAHELTFSI